MIGFIQFSGEDLCSTPLARCFCWGMFANKGRCVSSDCVKSNVLRTLHNVLIRVITQLTITYNALKFVFFCSNSNINLTYIGIVYDSIYILIIQIYFIFFSIVYKACVYDERGYNTLIVVGLDDNIVVPEFVVPFLDTALEEVILKH